ncbi:NAD(P)-dependent oxidoreductase [Hyphomicrobium sp. MC1]|uniref:NAD-dependent epimerase/dehydratase family protein n=1 Tax=Hyphomicrobium sp. (strain MC1) TaxID=717785 RepID=UPI000213D821|nr:NAD(P)-dependent oxidoreductase [Hyphomicrobium sp. MC1]CCB65051.1 NAD-dependent epimerase/dehydratase [Hyphomicrobium sp. MC1]
MRVLLTGATGFIGRQVLRSLVDDDIDVVVASRSHDQKSDRYRVEGVDLLDRRSVTDLISRTKPTHLLHLAWDVTPGQFWTSPNNILWTTATLELMRAFAEGDGRRAVFAGTCAEYTWDRPLLVETGPTEPATFYGEMKDVTRRGVCAIGKRFGIPTAWGRLFWLYGPHEAPGRLVSDVAAALLSGRPALCSDGLQKRDYLNVEDAGRAFVAALKSDWHGAFNIGSGRAVPVRDIILELSRELKREDLVRLGAKPSNPNDPPEITADVGVLRNAIGFSPRYSFEEGIRDTANWWRTNFRFAHG